MTSVHFWSIILPFQLVEGLQKHDSLSTNEWPCLKWLYHSYICMMPIALLPKAYWIFWFAKFVALLLFKSFCHFAQVKIWWACTYSQVDCQQLTHSADRKKLNACTWRCPTPHLRLLPVCASFISTGEKIKSDYFKSTGGKRWGFIQLYVEKNKLLTLKSHNY